MLQTIAHVLMLMIDVTFVYCLIKAIKLIGDEQELDYYQSPRVFIKGVFGSLVASIIIMICIDFKGVVLSIILTFLSIMAFALILTQHYKSETKAADDIAKLEQEEDPLIIEEIIASSEQSSFNGCLTLAIAVIVQFASIIVHIIGIYIPLIGKLIQWIF